MCGRVVMQGALVMELLRMSQRLFISEGVVVVKRLLSEWIGVLKLVARRSVQSRVQMIRKV